MVTPCFLGLPVERVGFGRDSATYATNVITAAFFDPKKRFGAGSQRLSEPDDFGRFRKVLDDGPGSLGFTDHHEASPSKSAKLN